MTKKITCTFIFTIFAILSLSNNLQAQKTDNQLYLVTLKTSSAFSESNSKAVQIDRATEIRETSAGLAKSVNADLVDVYDYVLGGFTAELSDDQVAVLRKNPKVSDIISLLRKATLPLTQRQNNPSWELDRLDKHNLPLNNQYQYGITGEGMDIFIFDTGIRLTHNEFTGRIGSGRNFFDFTNDLGDCNGHGTAMASLAAGTTWGVAKKATIHPVKIGGCNGSVTINGAILGLNWVVSELANNNVTNATVNMSFGDAIANLPPNFLPVILLFEQSIRDAVSQKVTVVAAAGNVANPFADPKNACEATPARVPEAITVGGIEEDDYQWFNSFTGSCVDVFAPANNLTFAGIADDTGSSFGSGTSGSAALVSGVAALHKQYKPYSTPASISADIIEESTKNVIRDLDAGSPNRLLYWFNYWAYLNGNGGSGQIHWWVINGNDKYVSGDFNGDGRDDMVGFNPNGWHHTMTFTDTWQWIEGNGSYYIGSWYISSTDKFYSGDFNGDGRDEILAINQNGLHHLLQFNGSSWQTIETGYNLGGWLINPVDKYIIGDYNGDSKDDVFVVNPNNGWQAVMVFSNGSWQSIQANGGNRRIGAGWVINTTDQYISGDYNGDGRDDIIALNQNGFHSTFVYNPGVWQSIEGNGSHFIGSWYISYNDKFVSGDFNGDGKDELLALNTTSQTIKFNGSWTTLSDSGDFSRLGYWYLSYNDSFIRGKFNGSSTDFLMGINPSGWWQVMRYQ